jgi:Zn-dependent protease with chaperone function
MILALLGLGLLLLALPAAVRSWASRRLRADEWTRAATASLVLGGVGVEAALVLAAMPAVASVLEAPVLLDHCRGALAPLADDPTLLSWVGGGAAALFAVSFVRGVCRAWVRARRARIEPWLGDHDALDDFDLVVVPTRELVAFGVPGSPPQVVVSEGLVEGLDPSAAAAVIDHEVAHHRLRHSVYLALLAGIDRAFGVWSVVRRGVEAARGAIEAWADEECGGDDERRRASLRRALLDISRTTPQTSERLRRLDARGAQHVRFAAYVPVGVIALAGLLLLAGWFTDAHHAVALGAPCAH